MDGTELNEPLIPMVIKVVPLTIQNFFIQMAQQAEDVGFSHEAQEILELLEEPLWVCWEYQGY